MATPTLLYGMPGTGQWEGNARPETWIPGIRDLDVRGDLPLVAMTQKLRKRKITDGHKIHWSVGDYYFETKAVTQTYNDAALSSAVSSTTLAAGTTIYVKGAAADIGYVRPRHLVRLTVAGYPLYSKVAMVTARVINGASSYFAATLVDTDAAVSGKSLQHVDGFRIMGNGNEQGAPAPSSVVTQPGWYDNVAQTWRTSLMLTGEELITNTRYGESEYKRRKAMKYLDHQREIEENILHGSYAPDATGDDGRPMPLTMGIMQFVRTYAPAANVTSYKTAKAGSTWIEAGEDWINESIEAIFAKGPRQRLCVCGNGVLNGLSRLVRANSLATLEKGRTSWGWDVKEWTHHLADLQFLTHPLFNTDTDLSHTALIIDPTSMEWCTLQETTFRKAKGDTEEGEIGIDGILEEWLTRGGLALGVPDYCGLLLDVGKDA